MSVPTPLLRNPIRSAQIGIESVAVLGLPSGEHIHPNTLMGRLRWLDIDLLGGRNTAIRELVTQVPVPVVAEMLGYSDQVPQGHADLAAQPCAKYVGP